MTQKVQVSRYQGSYLVGYVIMLVVLLRNLLHFQDEPALSAFLPLLASYTLLYALEPLLSIHFPWHRFFYFPVQVILTTVMANLQPYTDITNLLYIPLCVQAQQVFSRRWAVAWILFMTAMLLITLVVGMPGLEWLGLLVLYLSVGSFLISYDRLYFQTKTEQARSQVLLTDLQTAHQQLELYTVQAEELASARERNRLARELHDSVSQVIFSITLTAQSARLLLERDPARVPELLERLQEMTASALAQLRSLIAELRPTQGKQTTEHSQ